MQTNGTKKIKITKRKYLLGFVCVVLLLYGIKTLYRHIHSTPSKDVSTPTALQKTGFNSPCLTEFDIDRKSRIYSVPNFEKSFPDDNPVQLTAAQEHGIPVVQNREEANMNDEGLVYIGFSPYYDIARLNSSIPYLVPRAASLLQDIGRSFMDSLMVKHIPVHKIIVSSVLRTQDDVEKLRSHNANASKKSCHMYGTTFDISYLRYAQAGERPVRNDTLKWVLSEVLADMRTAERCYIKYEKHQSCYHVTVR